MNTICKTTTALLALSTIAWGAAERSWTHTEVIASVNKTIGTISSERGVMQLTCSNQHYTKRQSAKDILYRETYNSSGELLSRTSAGDLDEFTLTAVREDNLGALAHGSADNNTPVVLSLTSDLVIAETLLFASYQGHDLLQVKRDDSGNIYLLLRNLDDVSNRTLLKVTSTGDLLWNKALPATTFGLSPDGKVLLLNQKYEGKNTSETGLKTDRAHLQTTALSSAGEILWEQTFSGTYSTVGNAAVMRSDSSWLITGSFQSIQTSPYSSFDSDIGLLAIDHSGNELWRKHYKGKNKGCGGTGLYPTSDSTWVISGYQARSNAPAANGYKSTGWMVQVNNVGDSLNSYSFGSNSFEAYINARFGDTLFVSTSTVKHYKEFLIPTNLDTAVNFTADNSDLPTYSRSNQLSDATALNGKTYAVGDAGSFGNGKSDILFMSIDSSGEESLFTTTIGDRGNQSAAAITTLNGALYLTGQWDQRLWVGAVSPRGELLWGKHYSEDSSRGEAILPLENALLVSGVSERDSAYTVTLLALSTDGDTLWTANTPVEEERIDGSLALFGDEILLLSRTQFNAELLRFSRDGALLERKMIGERFDAITADSAHIYLGGTSSTNYGDGVVLALNENLETEWRWVGNSGYSDKVTDLLVTDGGVLFTGEYMHNSSQGITGGRIWFGKLNRAGELLWEEDYFGGVTTGTALVKDGNGWIIAGNNYGHSHAPGGISSSFPPSPFFARYQQRQQEGTLAAKESTAIRPARLVGRALTLALSNDAQQLTIVNAQGRSLLQRRIDAGVTEVIGLEMLPAGVYFCTMQSATAMHVQQIHLR